MHWRSAPWNSLLPASTNRLPGSSGISFFRHKTKISSGISTSGLADNGQGIAMTLCIAAIGSDGDHESIVCAMDRLVSMETEYYKEHAIGKFEHTIRRYSFIPPNSVAMIAGSPFVFNELVDIPSTSKTYTAIRDNISKNFKDVRDKVIQNEVFDALGVDKSLIAKSLMRDEINPLTEKILDRVAGFKFNASMLLVGFDKNNKAKISVINERAVVDTSDMFFTAIGAGYIQATNTLYFQKHTSEKSLMTTLYTVFKAKTNAEVHEGVGRETDLLIVQPDACLKVTRDQLALLQEIYNDELRYGANHRLLKEIDARSCEKCI
jgi:hypothetical protein